MTFTSFLAKSRTALTIAAASAGIAVAAHAAIPSSSSSTHPHRLTLNSEVSTLARFAHEGDEFAQFALARAYFLGEAVEKDEVKALYLFELSASQGYVPAQFLTARIHYKNKNAIHQDLAMYWFERAASAGLPQAQQYLDEMRLERQSAGIDHVAYR